MLFFCNSPELLKAQPSFPDFPLSVVVVVVFLWFFSYFHLFLPYPSVSFNQTYLGWKGIHFCLRKGLRLFRGGDDSGILKMNGFQKSSPLSTKLGTEYSFFTWRSCLILVYPLSKISILCQLSNFGLNPKNLISLPTRVNRKKITCDLHQNKNNQWQSRTDYTCMTIWSMWVKNDNNNFLPVLIFNHILL